MRRGGALSAAPAPDVFLEAVRARYRRLAEDSGPHAALGRVLAGTYLGLCRAHGVPVCEELVGDLVLDARPADPLTLRLPTGRRPARLLGEVHEALLSPSTRRARGAYYTPAPAARWVVDWALGAAGVAAGRFGGAKATVGDPTCGGGSFLLAAADALRAHGVPPDEVITERLYGADLDRRAVAVTRASLALWAGSGRTPARHTVVVADALTLTRAAWPPLATRGLSVVVGNPPFLGQLAQTTSRRGETAARARARFGEAAAPYADTAALVLLAALDLVEDGGAVAMLQPESFLAARDTEGVRRALASRASLRTLWLAGSELFDAAVRVCVPVLTRGRPSPAAGEVTVRTGAQAVPAARIPPPDRGSWGPLAAAAAGVPDPRIEAAGVLGDWCAATAGFRDEYYALVPWVRECAGDGGVGGDGVAPLVTSGLVDPGRCDWGRRPARFARRRWDAPAVPLAAAAGEDRLARWLRRCLAPKVVVATQTPVLEAAVDEHGRWVPCTPVISLTCPPARLWHAAAVLLSPVATAWALRTAHGAALSSSAVKLSARQVLGLPCPPAGGDWDAAAETVRRAATAGDGDTWRTALVDAGTHACRAFGLSAAAADELLAWWSARLPPWRRPVSAAAGRRAW